MIFLIRLEMRRINFEEHLKRKNEFTIKRLQRGRRRFPRLKERSSEELEVFLALIKERYKQFLERQELEKIAPRKWRMRI